MTTGGWAVICSNKNELLMDSCLFKQEFVIGYWVNIKLQS